MNALMLCACLLSQTTDNQTDWTGGPGVAGPVVDFGTAFAWSDSVIYTSTGCIITMTRTHAVADRWIEHVVEDNGSIDGHGALRPADFDGDGDYDLAGAIDGLNRVRVYRNRLVETGVATFASEVDVPVNVSKYCLTWVGDFNRDSRPDIVVPGDSMFWFENTGNWSFTRRFIGYVDHIGDTNFCDVGDVDNDGDMDIVNGMLPVVLWRNNGNGTFARESIYAGRRYRAKLGDLNGDGYLDLLQADWIFLNRGPGAPTVFPVTPSWQSGFARSEVDGIWITDFNSDRVQDVLLCRVWGASSTYAIYWYQNDGSGLNYVRRTIATGNNAHANGDAAIAEDMDLDGLVDVVGGYSAIGYFHQYPANTFTLGQVDPSFGGSGGCHWVEVENLCARPGGAKFTQDIMASGSGQFHWWENGLDTNFTRHAWLVSSVLDAGVPSCWRWLKWFGRKAVGTELDFYVRTGATPAQCTLNAWRGPFAASSAADIDSVGILPYTTAGDRCFQYRVFMAGNNDYTPNRPAILYDIWVRHEPVSSDVGVVSILAPVDTVDTGDAVVPAAVVGNFGASAASFKTWFEFGPAGSPAYRDSVQVTGLAPGDSTRVHFANWPLPHPAGHYPTRCSTWIAQDGNRANDKADGEFRVAAGHQVSWGWVERAPLPDAPSGRAIKDGGWLALEADSVYALKGNKVGDFYVCDIDVVSMGEWYVRPALPNGREAKPPYRGSAATSGDGYVFATKGNKTSGFWRYDLDSVVWRQMPDVPLGASGKRVKGGADLAYVVERDTGWVYLMKGCKSDFFRFNTVSLGWDTTLPPMPSGARAKWDGGSWLVRGDGGRLHAHKAKYHELWTFDLTAHEWSAVPLPGMPLVGVSGRSKKSKDGGSAAWHDGRVFALKGGNTQEFWQFDAALQRWTELETMPSFGSTGRKKRVKAGGDIVSYGSDHFFALKGNKTLEFWRYGLRPPVGRTSVVPAGVQAGAAGEGGRLRVVTNPLTSGRVSLDYSLPEPGPVTLRLYDMAGRRVLARAVAAGRAGRARLDLGQLAAGVYLARLDAGAVRGSAKLIVE